MGNTIMLFATEANGCQAGPSGMLLSPDLMQVNELDTNTNESHQTILENQQVIVNNQLKIMQAVAKLQTGVDYLMEKDMTRNTEPRDPSKVVFEPVDSVDMLDSLEESLKEPDAAGKYISSMGFICGTDGKANGMDCCYKLIDHFITRDFMHSCSWTGNAKATDENDPMNTLPTTQSEASTKVPLKFYANFRSLFLKLIRLADKDFTELKCDEFFKRVMKNSKARLNSKSSSKHKNRPNNLQYKSRKGDKPAENELENASVDESHEITKQSQS